MHKLNTCQIVSGEGASCLDVCALYGNKYIKVCVQCHGCDLYSSWWISSVWVMNVGYMSLGAVNTTY